MTIQGNLRSFDQGMNLVLIDSNDISKKNVTRLNKILIRGDNIMMLSLSSTTFNSLTPKDDDASI